MAIFLGKWNCLAKFDPCMQEHVRRITDNEIHDHHLGKNVQNEIIHLMGNATLEKIISHIHKAKYFSIILDCTPDISHEEQMTMIIRIVHIDGSSVEVREYFVEYIAVDDSTGSNLTDQCLRVLSELKLDLGNCRGQGYDNGSNIKAVRFQIRSVYDALVDVSEDSKDPKARTEAAALAKQLKNFPFLVSLAIWYDILSQLNVASKILQNENMHYDVALKCINTVSDYLVLYRENGLELAEATARELANELEMPSEDVAFPAVASLRRRRTFRLGSPG
ncbi:uncharacterized protein LOC120526452 [Polypterus senegalus]|uniref:uncharacterized protein LOC120526452 n=1 Tax=Polypterus senegalus TaxID=55291 RepID=UPI001965DA81|nr:uncharacterized protein LOC120526452 [Polypterus senegalus]